MVARRGNGGAKALIHTREVSARERYDLLTSLVVPRPIAWLSTRSAGGDPNLAPFSYFSALAATPMLVGVSIGHRRDEPKDSLRNIRDTGAFCVNVVTEPQLEAMNRSAAEVAHGVDEFELAGLPLAEASTVAAPYVATCPAVMECRLHQEVELRGATNTLIIGEVTAIRLGGEVSRVPGTGCVDTGSLRPVGRLWGPAYALLGEIRTIDRPAAE